MATLQLIPERKPKPLVFNSPGQISTPSLQRPRRNPLVKERAWIAQEWRNKTFTVLNRERNLTGKSSREKGKTLFLSLTFTARRQTGSKWKCQLLKWNEISYLVCVFRLIFPINDNQWDRQDLCVSINTSFSLLTQWLCNRPFPSCLLPLAFQNESSFKTFLMKMSLICMKMNLKTKRIFITTVSNEDSFWNRGKG